MEYYWVSSALVLRSPLKSATKAFKRISSSLMEEEEEKVRSRAMMIRHISSLRFIGLLLWRSYSNRMSFDRSPFYNVKQTFRWSFSIERVEPGQIGPKSKWRKRAVRKEVKSQLAHRSSSFRRREKATFKVDLSRCNLPFERLKVNVHM